jgi:hypothetical protein
MLDNGIDYRKESMMTTAYGFGTTIPVPYEEAIPRVKEALKAEGFGVLTEIDVRRTRPNGVCYVLLLHLVVNQQKKSENRTERD